MGNNMPDALQERLTEATERYERLTRAMRRRATHELCETYDDHELTTELSFACLGHFSEQTWWDRMGIQMPLQGCWAGINIVRCLVCGERFLCDYCREHPIRLNPDQKVGL